MNIRRQVFHDSVTRESNTPAFLRQQASSLLCLLQILSERLCSTLKKIKRYIILATARKCSILRREVMVSGAKSSSFNLC